MGTKYHKSHGQSSGGKRTSEYIAWDAMKQRCSNPNYNHYDRYGGRGIKVCQSWLDSFENFLKDMGLKPFPNHTLDRIENDEDYTPSNCRWATRKEQGNNRSTNIRVMYEGRIQTLKQWAEEFNMSYNSMYYHFKKRNIQEV